MSRYRFPGLSVSIVGRLSVRIRIFVLIGLSLVGLAAVGAVFWWSQDRVETAFTRAEAFARLASGVEDLERTAGTMRIVEKDYLATPGAEGYARFGAVLANAREHLARLAGMPVSAPLATEITKVAATFDNIDAAFAELHGVQQRLGFNNESGALGDLASLGGSLHQRVTKLARFNRSPATAKLNLAVIDLQRSEKAYLLDRSDVALGGFEVAAGRFERALSRAKLAPEVSGPLGETMAAYRAAFDLFSAAGTERTAQVERLEAFFDVLPPYLETLAGAADGGKAEAAKALAEGRELASLIMAGILIATLLVLLGAGALIGGSIAAPLTRLRAAMERLASGETEIDLPEAPGRTELDAMVRSVAVFRDTAREQGRLAAAQAEGNAARDQRMAHLETLIAGFEATVEAALSRLDQAAADLAGASDTLDEAADGAASEATRAGEAVRVAADNVTSAASASEQLNASIAEIASQANRSTEVAEQAMGSARTTGTSMGDLSATADRIGEVMGLIREIANQTNLLALNATIEAARAGEHGRGFAVVAAEVKDLASQTAKATEEIAQQVGAIQSASASAVSAIDEVGEIIREMNEIAASVAGAVAQQSAALGEITEHVAEASHRSGTGAEAMARVSRATEHARGTGALVGELSDTLGAQAAVLRKEIGAFLDGVRAA